MSKSSITIQQLTGTSNLGKGLSIKTRPTCRLNELSPCGWWLQLVLGETFIGGSDGKSQNRHGKPLGNCPDSA